MFVTDYLPSEKRRSYATGGVEQRITEAAVMLAFAFHLIDHGATQVSIHPDGEHAKIFDIQAFLARKGFRQVEASGSTSYGGRYTDDQVIIVVRPASGFGDVVADLNGEKILAECKGGAINTSHPGQKSRLRRGLCELIGQLMLLPADGTRQIAVLPATAESRRLSEKLAPRCSDAGIEIALVEVDGSITYVEPNSSQPPSSALISALQALQLDGVDLARDQTPTRDLGV